MGRNIDSCAILQERAKQADKVAKQEKLTKLQASIGAKQVRLQALHTSHMHAQVESTSCTG